MFHAGQHQLAIDYLSASGNLPEVIDFAKNVYQTYWQKYSSSIPKEVLNQFTTEFDRQYGGLNDIYKEALFSLMIGSKISTVDNDAFWNFLIPDSIESQLWVNLKLAAYDHREDSSAFLGMQLPNFYTPITLEDVYVELEK
jgi:hypothetical protein